MVEQITRQGSPGKHGLSKYIGIPNGIRVLAMGGEMSKREGVLLRPFQSETKSFCCFYHRLTQIYVLITISLLDIGFKWPISDNYDLFLLFREDDFGNERVHLLAEGALAHLQNH